MAPVVLREFFRCRSPVPGFDFAKVIFAECANKSGGIACSLAALRAGTHRGTGADLPEDTPL